MIIDSHQHFWKYNTKNHAWITDEMSVIKRDFMPDDLIPLLAANMIDGCVAVQADQTEDETHFLLNLAEEHKFIKGVVGWVDFRSEDIDARLEYFSNFKKLKGFRHIVQAEPQEDFLLGKAFCNGIGSLKKYRFTYDLLVFPKQLPYVLSFVKLYPDQLFVVDHLAKPYIKSGKIDEWRKDIIALAQFSNVHCKLSGMVTEANWSNWKTIDFKPYVDVVLESFGIDRVMFGSDWPVSLLAASYDQCYELLHNLTHHLSSNEKDKLWGTNATQFYNLLP
ncbi:amidohydrolase family protein [Solitalea lacus]|uniref:amidohydrolase family protein n=1 Tax=Solitalea lacus TaxID=2911172 RepID=UPI001EDA699B|nr:amidohydrolase family protein [Solitalea lacus]UKJ05873.1 amidohydrolase family protein [Solitalea lacus]